MSDLPRARVARAAPRARWKAWCAEHLRIRPPYRPALGLATLQLAALAVFGGAAGNFEPCEAMTCAIRPDAGDMILVATTPPPWVVEPHLEARRVAGLVYAGGVPAPNASLELRYALPAEAQGLPVHTRSDQDGHFDFGLRPAGTYSVVAHAPGFAPTAILIAPHAPPRDVWAELVLHLQHCAQIQGRVVDMAGAPIAGARIEQMQSGAKPTKPLNELRLGPVHEDRSDADGRFDICAGHDTTIVVSAPGFGWVVLERPGSFEEPGITLPPGATVQGTVQDENGNPVAAALVALMPTRRYEPQGRYSAAVSAVDGTFTIRGVPPGRFQLVGSHRSYSSPSVRPAEVDVGIGAALRGLVVPLRRCAAGRTGTVTSDGRPVADAPVQLFVDTVTTASSLPWSTTNAEGRFVVDCAPGEQTNETTFAKVAGSWQLPSSRGFPATATGEDARLEVEPMRPVTGRVTLDGRPMPGAIVTERDEPGFAEYEGMRITRTRLDGTFSLPLPGSEVPALAAIVPGVGRGYSAWGANNVQIELDARSSLELDVVDTNGAPVANARVDVHDAAVPRYCNGIACPAPGTTDSHGHAVLHGLGRGVYDVELRGSLPAGKDWPRIEIPTNRSNVHAELVVRPHTGTVAGRVVRDDGEPAVWARVSAPMQQRTYTDANGRFELTGLSAKATGTLITTSAEGLRIFTESVPRNTRDLTIEAPRFGAIAGTVLDPCEGCKVSIHPIRYGGALPRGGPAQALTAVVRNGAFSFPRAYPWAYTVSIPERKDLAMIELTVLPTQTAIAVITSK